MGPLSDSWFRVSPPLLGPPRKFVERNSWVKELAEVVLSLVAIKPDCAPPCRLGFSKDKMRCGGG